MDIELESPIVGCDESALDRVHTHKAGNRDTDASKEIEEHLADWTQSLLEGPLGDHDSLQDMFEGMFDDDCNSSLRCNVLGPLVLKIDDVLDAEEVLPSIDEMIFALHDFADTH